MKIKTDSKAVEYAKELLDYLQENNSVRHCLMDDLSDLITDYKLAKQTTDQGRIS